MNLAINGKNVDIGEALRGRVEGSLNTAVAKSFDNALEGTETFSRGAHLFRVHISVHAGRGMVMQGPASSDEAYVALDGALTRIAKQLRRYKRRLDARHKGRGEETLAAQQYILAAESEDAEVAEDDNPTIVAEMPTEIGMLTVGEAVMGMDLVDTPAMMLRNRAHRRLNVVYRRPDGNIGWIDPEAHSA